MKNNDARRTPFWIFKKKHLWEKRILCYHSNIIDSNAERNTEIRLVMLFNIQFLFPKPSHPNVRRMLSEQALLHHETVRSNDWIRSYASAVFERVYRLHTALWSIHPIRSPKPPNHLVSAPYTAYRSHLHILRRIGSAWNSVGQDNSRRAIYGSCVASCLLLWALSCLSRN